MSVLPDHAPEDLRIAGLAVKILGPREAPALLLSSGLGGSGAYWMPHLATLPGRFRVILYDHRGTGRSDRSLPKPYALANMARDIALILDGLEIAGAHLVGHAAGGMAALHLAAQRPDAVRSVTVINGWDAPDAHFARCMEVRKAIIVTQGAKAYLRAQPVYLYPAQWISDHFDELDRQIEAHTQDFQSQDVLLARMGALLDEDRGPALGEVNCPVLLVASRDDMLVPARRSQALREALVGAPVTMALRERGGHAVNVTEPEWFESTLLAFLTKN